MTSPKISSIQVRRGTKVEWETANPQLLDGEIGYETNTYRVKIGRRNDNGQLINWNDLKYQSPYSGFDKPVYPQEGDFWVEETTKNLYYFDGDEWTQILNSLNPQFEGNVNLENACITGDLLPCADVTFDIGSEDKRWKDLHIGDPSSSGNFHITVGESSAPENIGGYRRLQLNGDDIVVRDDFKDITTHNLSLWRTTDPNGNLNPIPSEYEGLAYNNSRNLPDTGGITHQDTMNEWIFESLFNIVGMENSPNFHTQQYWNTSQFEQKLKAQRGVETPISGNETDYGNKTTESTYFHKADGSVSDRVPLEQSYWIDVPRLSSAP